MRIAWICPVVIISAPVDDAALPRARAALAAR